MTQIKTFNRQWQPEKLDDEVNEWMDKHPQYKIIDVRHSVWDGFHTAIVIYKPDVKL